MADDASVHQTDTEHCQRRSRSLQVLLLIALIGYVAHFLYFPQFGLYEDDYFYTLPWFGADWQQWWNGAVEAVLHPIQARPLNHLIRRTLFALCLQGQSVEMAYLASWILITVNAALLFRLLARRFSATAGAVAALVYLLHPADTSRQILMHQTDIHLGALLLIASLNLFLARRSLAAWCVAATILLTYESFYLPLLVAPLLLSSNVPGDRRSAMRHAAIWFMVLTAIAAVRLLLGEERAAAVAGSPIAVGSKILIAQLIGPFTSLRLLAVRPLDAVVHLTPMLAVCAVVVVLASWRLLRSTNCASRLPPQGMRGRCEAWAVAGGLLGLSLSYTFAFRPDYYPPILSIGRLTAVHVPGIICTAIALGAATAWMEQRIRANLAAGIHATVAAVFGLMAAFSLEIQRTEYAEHWAQQREFWHQIFAQSGDADSEDVIVIDIEGAPGPIPMTQGFPRFGNVNYPPLAFRYFADLPGDWANTPRVYGLWADTPATQTPAGLRLGTPPWMGSDQHPVLHDGGFLFFRVENGRLQRVENAITIQGYSLQPKPISATLELSRITPSALFQSLARTGARSNWSTVRNAVNYPR